MKRKFTCAHCHSEEVVRDAWASWDEDKQEWVLDNIFDQAYCNTCEHETSLTEEVIAP